jgi:hypothetical protein
MLIKSLSARCIGYTRWHGSFTSQGDLVECRFRGAWDILGAIDQPHHRVRIDKYHQIGYCVKRTGIIPSPSILLRLAQATQIDGNPGMAAVLAAE